MIKFCTFFSSSSGNCVFLSDGDTNLLIDAGVSAARIKKALEEIDVSPQEIDAILITHEHSDHISGVRVLASKYSIPVYANEATMNKVIASVGAIPNHLVKIMESGSQITIRSAKVMSFRTPHDAAESVGYVVSFDGEHYGVATDTGCITKGMLKYLAKCTSVLIESNHDVEMLNNGSYPYPLKKRILSDCGHLSNSDCAWLATQLAIWGVKHIALGHLSDNNNTSEKAYAQTAFLLKENGIDPEKDIIFGVAPKEGLYHI